MKPSSFKDFLLKTHKAYCHIAKLEIIDGKLVLKNKLTGTKHVFVNGENEITLDSSQLRIAKEFLKNH